ncbi:MAG TPA: glycerol-3-phosphate dehydrogenase, partial [Rhodospirillaceae bacterium]|nr:glycerol-3-phosphate dehydrogenase [Rhodospirillaceae bacterium]
MNKTADIIVIGGGIAGIGAAAMIAPDAKVIVLETEDVIGSHSTGRSAAIYIRNYGNATLRALNAASEPLLQNPEKIGETSVLSPRGEMLVAREEEIPELEAYLNGAEGIERLSPAEAINLFPLLREEAVAAAAIERSAQDID